MLVFGQFLLERVFDSLSDLVTHYHKDIEPVDGQYSTVYKLAYEHPDLPNVETSFHPQEPGTAAVVINHRGPIANKQVGITKLPHMFAHGLASAVDYLQHNTNDVGRVHFSGATAAHNRLYDRVHQAFERGDYADHPVLGKYFMIKRGYQYSLLPKQRKQ